MITIEKECTQNIFAHTQNICSRFGFQQKLSSLFSARHLLLLGALALRGGCLHGGAIAFLAQLPPQLLEQLRLRGARVGEALREDGQLGVCVANDLRSRRRKENTNDDKVHEDQVQEDKVEEREEW